MDTTESERVVTLKKALEIADEFYEAGKKDAGTDYTTETSPNVEKGLDMIYSLKDRAGCER